MWHLVYLAVLFVVLTPGVLLTLPKGGSKVVVAATHAVIFAAVCQITRRFVVERFQDEGEEEEGEKVKKKYTNKKNKDKKATGGSKAKKAPAKSWFSSLFG